MPAIVEVSGLVKEFKTFERRPGVWGALVNLFHRDYRALKAVDRIEFSIARGEMVGYIGPNGAGKSTTIKMLTGILVPTAGKVMANGFVPWKQRSAYTRTVGAVFGQRTQLWWDIAVQESFQLLKKIYEVPEADFRARMKHFDEILELGRYLQTPVRKLSLGQRMRCDVAAALLHNPPLVFLDEPTIGLDLVAKENIRQFLKEINRNYGTTMLLTTHDLSDIEELCRRLMVIDEGRLLFDGNLAELKNRFWKEHAVRIEVKDSEQGRKLESLPLAHVRCGKIGRSYLPAGVPARSPHHRRRHPRRAGGCGRAGPGDRGTEHRRRGEAHVPGGRARGAGPVRPATFAEFLRIGFVNMLAFRLRYYTGVITYFINVSVYYFIWKAVFAASPGFGGFNFAQMITYVAVGWVIRSLYFNNIDNDMANDVMEGKIATTMLRPVSLPMSYIARSLGESIFRLVILTVPTSAVIFVVFPVKGPVGAGNLRGLFRGAHRQHSHRGRVKFRGGQPGGDHQVDSGPAARQVLDDGAALADCWCRCRCSPPRCGRCRPGCRSSTSTLRR